ncbi:tRNA pseudouridine(38-40) synthase TruA [Acidovorax sp. NCPPB 4044]|uniref:tRNA pseudouridine(38-40) synthase TruA n=1 Tax=Acidovorax sp. NCPPB 4044 TaxID=2940490 RepID=UPI002302ABD7|nr:tRNA pseudouridine(38-40) synthase TruA [Acidovorax sp. NCPPB 4044]MDA8519724.1 tRNA pseudouridine(38-40) synthase TruA [Acidovorax sp. NCPPB 4044]
MRVALGVSYNGAGYRGWQSQSDGLTVQDRLEAALARFATHEVSTLCAGRTDAGVHGLMQVVHFDTPLERTPFSWVRGTNTFLPPDIAVQWARPVPETFHSRACATARRYAYVLLQSAVRPSVDAGRVGWVFHALDEVAMRSAAQHLLGEHDFTSFRASACQAKSPVKTLHRIEISRRGLDGAPPADVPADRHDIPSCYWRFEFEGNAFLHHMVRNIMGCLVAVGQGKYPADWMRAVLAARSRDAAAPTFSPDGLYFLGPVYDAAWGLPERTAAYDWLP